MDPDIMCPMWRAT